MTIRKVIRLAAIIAITGSFATAARAEETLKLAVGAPGNWDSGVPEMGQRAGIFKKHGLKLDLLYTNGGGETMQAVLGGGVDIGIAAGTGAVMGAYVKGAPLRIILAGTTGAGDLYWYVPTNSPIKDFKEAAGKTAGFSTVGASTHITLLKLLKYFDSKAVPIATGAGQITYTQAMSGQIDIGWASPPFGLEPLDDKKIRLIATGNDVPSLRNQTVRVHIVNTNSLATKKAQIDEFIAAYKETLDWIYSNNPDALKTFSEMSHVPVGLAQRIREQFLPLPAMQSDVVSGLDGVMADSVEFKMIQKPLTEEQLSGLMVGPKWSR